MGTQRMSDMKPVLQTSLRRRSTVYQDGDTFEELRGAKMISDDRRACLALFASFRLKALLSPPRIESFSSARSILGSIVSGFCSRRVGRSFQLPIVVP